MNSTRTPLFDPERHEPLNKTEWSADRALETTHEIFDFLLAGLQNDEGLWPAHPSEDSAIQFNKSLYFGAAGTLWTLMQLSTRLNRELPFNPIEFLNRVANDYRRDPDTQSVVPSFLLGETGILLFQHRISPSDETATKIRELIASNSTNPVNEALWGCPGTMPAALAIGDEAGFKAGADYLFKEWKQNEQGTWVWVQDLYGNILQLVGAGHGFFGNVYPLLEGFSHLSSTQQSLVIDRTIETALRSVLREDGMANWPTSFVEQDSKKPRGKIMVQWCHGAPGAITSLKSFPKDASSELEKVLTEAGELIWHAGPLKKGIGICHGTDGNGYAFLRLYERTGDEKWLMRARAFAMHSLPQRSGRYTLWTGEAGLAMYLLACIDAKPDWPTLDYI